MRFLLVPKAGIRAFTCDHGIAWMEVALGKERGLVAKILPETLFLSQCDFVQII